jgi:hypothetical protein
MMVGDLLRFFLGATSRVLAANRILRTAPLCKR